jgi:ArsR family transcriptional regulator
MVLDDLGIGARKLWVTVRQDMSDELSDTTLEEDDRRMAAVLAERRSDSLAYFGRVAGEWDAIRGQLFGSRFTAEALLSLLPPGWRVVDIGCGTGNIAELLAPHVAEVVAVDLSEPMLEAARRRLDGQENVDFRIGSADDLPLDDGSCDAATAGLMLHHVDDPLAVLREARRVLKPNGVLLIIEMLPHDRAEYREQMGHLHLGFSEAELRDLCTRAGFGEPRVCELPVDPEGRGPGLFAAVCPKAGGRGDGGGRK